MNPHLALLAGIAQEHLNIPTLETRRSDHLDFHTVSVWCVAAALEAAFVAGVRTSTTSRCLDSLLQDVMGCDNPAFTAEHVAFLQDRIEVLTSSIHFPNNSGV